MPQANEQDPKVTPVEQPVTPVEQPVVSSEPVVSPEPEVDPQPPVGPVVEVNSPVLPLEPEKEPVEVVPAQSDEQSPGTGIDTDGDGNADQVVEADDEPAEPHVDHEDDYVGKVKLSQSPGDAVPKQTATKLIKASNINQHYKDEFYEQIKDGELKPQYVEAYRRIKAASDSGAIYNPGSLGL